MLQRGIIAPVSSTSSQELDSARSRSGLFFARFNLINVRTLACHHGHRVAFVHAKLGFLQIKVV